MKKNQQNLARMKFITRFQILYTNHMMKKTNEIIAKTVTTLNEWKKFKNTGVLSNPISLIH